MDRANYANVSVMYIGVGTGGALQCTQLDISVQQDTFRGVNMHVYI